MNFRKTVLFIAVAALALPVVANAAEAMKPGKWQITIETEMPGMPMKMPAMTFERCVTPEEAATPQPPKSKKDDTCKIEDYKLDGNTVTWKINCEKNGMTGHGKMTFAAESWQGESVMNMKDPRSGESMDITQKMAGKRTGDCAADKK